MGRRRLQRLTLNLAALSLCAAALSCNNIVDSLSTNLPNPNDVTQVPVQRDAVVPALLPLIDANALFRFPTPNVGLDEMTLDTALVQARSYLFYGLNFAVLRGAVEGQRGAFIDFPTLITCSRPQLVRSVYERPPDSLPNQLRMQLGSYWTIPFCGSRRTPELVVSVATLGNGARYKNGQSVGDTVAQDRAFRPFGIPWEWEVEHMVTPEQAVNEVYSATGARAAQLPELVTAVQINGRQPLGSNWCPVWRVSLERAVLAATAYSSRRLALTELYVRDSQCPGLLGRPMLLTPWTEQPTSREFTLILRDSTAVDGFRRIVHVAKYRAPVVFESVTIEK
jgi:hypothetical protein